jgi:hypothetical protein
MPARLRRIASASSFEDGERDPLPDPASVRGGHELDPPAAGQVDPGQTDVVDLVGDAAELEHRDERSPDVRRLLDRDRGDLTPGRRMRRADRL